MGRHRQTLALSGKRQSPSQELRPYLPWNISPGQSHLRAILGAARQNLRQAPAMAHSVPAKSSNSKRILVRDFPLDDLDRPGRRRARLTIAAESRDGDEPSVSFHHMWQLPYDQAELGARNNLRTSTRPNLGGGSNARPEWRSNATFFRPLSPFRSLRTDAQSAIERRIVSRSRDHDRSQPPPQIRTSGVTASGSHLG
jgi:hypothetical protein